MRAGLCQGGAAAAGGGEGDQEAEASRVAEGRHGRGSWERAGLVEEMIAAVAAALRIELNGFDTGAAAFFVELQLHIQ